MRSHSIFTHNDQANSNNEQLSLLCIDRLKLIDDMHKKLLKNLETCRHTLIISLTNHDLLVFNGGCNVLKGELNRYYTKALSSLVTIEFTAVLRLLKNYPSDPYYATSSSKNIEDWVNASIDVIIEHVNLQTLQVKKRILDDCLSASQQSQSRCSIQ